MEILQTVLVAVISSSIVAAIVSLILKYHFDRKLENFKSQIKNEELVAQSRWEIKRRACLNAFNIVDAYFANAQWETGITNPELQERPQIEIARQCCNELALSCERDNVLKAFLKCIGVYGETTCNMINELRNEVTKELRFGSSIELDDEHVWIARINEQNTDSGS